MRGVQDRARRELRPCPERSGPLGLARVHSLRAPRRSIAHTALRWGRGSHARPVVPDRDAAPAQFVVSTFPVVLSILKSQKAVTSSSKIIATTPTPGAKKL